MNGFSPWYHFDSRPAGGGLWKRQTGDFDYDVHHSDDSLWLTISFRRQPVLALRTGYFPGNGFRMLNTAPGGNRFVFQADTSVGRFQIELSIPDPSFPLVRCITKLTPACDLRIPFWPRDLMVLRSAGKEEAFDGEIFVAQEGTRSGWLFGGIRSTDPCAFLYFQNLTALNDYARTTHTSLGDIVGGKWPELGTGLPPSPEKALPAGREMIIGDAYLAMHPQLPEDENELAALFLELTGKLYLHLPLPPTSYKPWPTVLQRTLRDLEVNCGCWYRAGGHSYLNAYLCDYDTAPEIMVQLAVLLPLLDYQQWSGESLKIISALQAGIPSFYDEKIRSMGRWLPSAMDKLDRSEEHKRPRVMDSWYLHHPLVNLARMVMESNGDFRDLLLDSVEYAIRVAHHFKYEWPVFYHLDTLEVIKAETAPGKGGEHDVAGIYAHLMLLMYDMTKEERFLEEAAAAGRALEKKGFHMFYQANVTAFAAKALLRLYLVKREEIFRKVAITAIAGLIRNTGLWDCNYGFGENLATFFVLFPLNDAPYAAVYEEQEVLASFHDIIKLAPEAGIPAHITLLLSEFIRYMLHRASFYYPPMVSREMLAEKPKTGEIEPDTWIPVEDLQDGWNQSGTVGQEVYGAGLAFCIVPRHYKVLKDQGCTVYVDYPTGEIAAGAGGSLSFNITGHPAMFCRMRILPAENGPLPAVTVKVDGDRKEGKQLDDGSREFFVPGACTVELVFE
ncbi:hypothetical protein ACQKLP_12545 [Chitinophaga sp. NPDC101104]|uniref:hypothetical protein n=1 Tax=Chitinophaga sp. NPDC101104 TaxID=3390561 RepID=UPI003CFD10C4